MNSLTVSEILKLDILKNVSIRAGVSGLSRTVKGITTAEDPDLIQWLKGGEVLITSLYGAITGPYSFEDYIKELASKNVSALIIKPGSKLPEIPKEIIENGNIYSIPIIELPENITFIEVVSAVMTQILSNKANYYIEVQDKLSQLLASGAQEQDILDYLVTYVPALITLCDSNKDILFSAQSKEFKSEVAIADRISLPVMAMGEVNGYLEAVLNQVLDESLENLLKIASNLLGVFSLKKYYVAELEQKYISAFINDIFCGNLDEKQIEEKAKGYGWNKNDVFLVASIQLEATRNASKIPKALLEIAQLIPRDNYFLCIQEDCLHMLYKTSNEESSPEPYDTITETITTLKQYIEKTYSFFTFYAGISSIISDTAQISQIVREAADALLFGHTFKNTIVKYDDLGALRMLASSSHQENMKQIIPPPIWKLAEYDKTNNTQYLDTLDSLLGNNLNLSKTAKELFIHYKTMLHRMERINQIAEISLDDRNVRLDIELGVKLYMMLPK